MPGLGPRRSLVRIGLKYPVTATDTCFLIYIRSGTMISLHRLGDVGVADPIRPVAGREDEMWALRGASRWAVWYR